MCRAGSDTNGNTLKPLFKTRKERKRKAEPLSNLEAWGSNLKTSNLELNPLDWTGMRKYLQLEKKKEERKKKKTCAFEHLD